MSSDYLYSQTVYSYHAAHEGHVDHAGHEAHASHADHEGNLCMIFQ